MLKDKIFFIVQGLLKYNAFEFGVALRSIFYSPFFKSFGRNVKIRDGVNFKYPSEISIGDNVKIEHYCIFVGKGGLSIGNDCLIGAGVKIITSDHNYHSIEKTIDSQGLRFEPVVIENNVWLGFDVKILAGSVVGEGSIVGSGSLVNGVVIHKNSVVAGTPVRTIKIRE